MTNPFPTYDRTLAERWDQEWLKYLNMESIYAHILPSSDLKLVGDLKGKAPREVWKTYLTHHFRMEEVGTPPLRVWCNGDDLIGANVLEIGCGCGFFGKQIGLVANSYLGLDYSHFALTIARGVSAPNCEYRHIADSDALLPKKGSYDIMVGREFFIHQNFELASSVFGMAKYLLKPGAVLSADFFEPDPDVEPGRIYPAKSPLDPSAPSAGFFYTDAEVEELAKAHGFSVESVDFDKNDQRRFVLFRSN